MGRLFVVVIAVGLLLMALGMVLLGAFSPEPHPQQIQKVIPNDRFQQAN